MTASTGSDRLATYIEGPTAGSLEARASRILKILAALNVAGIVLALLSPATISTLLIVTFDVAAGSLAALYAVAAAGLDRRRPWAVAAARPLLVLVGLAGALTVLVAFQEGRVRIPFEVALVIWALLGPRDPTLSASLAPRGGALVGAAAAALALMLVARPLADWGGLLDVHQSDIAAAVEVDCGTPGTGPPATLVLGYDWAWRSTSPLPNGSDIVVLGWTGDDDQGRPLYTIGDIPTTESGIYSGYNGYPSTEMASLIGEESEQSFRWAIRLYERGYASGHIELELQRAGEIQSSSNPATLTIAATYVHLGVWRDDVTKVTCTW
jgi:hypothetical protein